MSAKRPLIELSTSPHVSAPQDVTVIMRNVVYALIPICAYAVYQFGISVLLLILVVTATCVLTERFFNWVGKTKSTINDWSAVITGMLLALTLPPGFALWMGVVAGFVAIALGKALFGGLGFNVFNPALMGRAFVQAAFPVAISTFTPAFFTGRFSEFIPSTLTLPFQTPPDVSLWVQQVSVDGFTGATPLALRQIQLIHTDLWDLFLGVTAGSAGGSATILILICGAYLAYRKMLDWRIPAAIFLGVIITSGILHLIDPKFAAPMFMLLSGGLMLGAIFMATDMVTSPMTPKGQIIYGIGIGIITICIRMFGAYPEGISFAILIMNAVTPLINTYVKPKRFGGNRS